MQIDERTRRAPRRWRIARDFAEGHFEVIVEEATDVRETIVRHAEAADLVVMGIQQAPGASRIFGSVVRDVAESTDVPLILIGGRHGRPMRS